MKNVVTNANTILVAEARNSKLNIEGMISNTRKANSIKSEFKLTCEVQKMGYGTLQNATF